MAVADYVRRGFKDDVPATTLNGNISDSASTITCASLTGWSGTTTNGPAGAVINLGEADEEFIFYAGISGSDLTGVTRLAGQAHTSGASIQHSSGKRDFDEANLIVSGLALCRARVYNDAAISIDNNTSTTLTFNTERYDGASLHDTGSNTGRLTAPRAGKYLITTHVEFAANATGYRQVALVLNGGANIASDVRPAVTGGVATQVSVTTVYALAASDYVTVVVAQGSGSALNVTASGNISPEFAMSWLGP